MNNKKGRNKIIYSDSDITKLAIESKKYGNFEVIIDTEDYEKIKKYNWCISYYKNRNGFYVMTNVYSEKKHTTLKLQRYIKDVSDNNVVDHINGDTFDNRKSNLRICTQNQNSKNQSMPKNNKSGFKGVYFHKRLQKYESYIGVNKERIRLGLFEHKIDAAIAYNNAAIKYHGEFAKLNNLENTTVRGI